MPGFLTGVQEGMGGGKKDDKDKKKQGGLMGAVETLGGKIAGKIKGKKKSDSDDSGGDTQMDQMKKVGGFKRGGRVKKTGLAKVHKGERVLTPKQNKKYSARKRQRR